MSTPPKRTQRERTEESYRRLAVAAIELFAEQGYAATTAIEIGERAGYSRGMVRARFGTKADLLNAILSSEYEQHIDREPSQDATGLERILQRIDGLIEMGRVQPGLMRALLILNFEATRGDPDLHARIVDWLDRIHQHLVDAFRAGFSDGTVVITADPSQAARDLVAAGIGIAFWWVVKPNDVDLVVELSRWREDVRLRLESKPGSQLLEGSDQPDCRRRVEPRSSPPQSTLGS